jgi:CxxC motif-containing protein
MMQVRGADYGVNEMTNPTRVLTTTVTLSDASIKRLPVRTSGRIPKDLIKKAMESINKVEVKAPIATGQVVVKNILNTGVDVIASRSISKNS